MNPEQELSNPNGLVMKRILISLIGLACWLSAGIVQAAFSDPAQIQTEAYVNLVQADQGLDAGRLDEALAQYKVARDYYQQLASDFPGWEPRIVQYRKTYCDNQVTDIERRMNGGMPMNAPELAPLPTPAPAPARVVEPVAVPEPAPTRAEAERSVEVDYLKSRIASLESELEDMDDAQSEYDALNDKYTQRVQDLQAAKQKLSEQADSRDSAMDRLHADLLAKDVQIQALQMDAAAKKELDQVLNDMEAKVNELRLENMRLKAEITTLDSELDDAEIRADQAQLSAQQAEANLKDSGDFAKRLKKAKADLKKAKAGLKKSEKRVARLENTKTELQAAERRVKETEADLTKAQKRIAQLEKSEAELIATANRVKGAEKALEQAESKLTDAEKELSIAQQKPIFKTDQPQAETATVVEPFIATVPPKSIPQGIAPADYVRQLLQDGENDAALATVQQARKSQPADTNLILIEGISLIRLQRYDEAAAMLIDLAKNNLRNPEVNATLGAAMMGAGFYDEARETLLIAVKLDKNLPECQYNLAQLYAFIDPISIKKARKYYKAARDLGLPADPQLEKALK